MISSTVIVDPVVGNILVSGPAGLSVSCTAVNACIPAAAPFTTADSNCIDFSGSGTPGSPLTAVPIIDPAATNLVSCTPTGLSVSCEAVQDCVGAGFTDGLIYDDAGDAFRARIDPAPGNTITQSPTGLFVPSGAATITVADTSCLDFSGDGSGGNPVTAVPIIDPAAGNLTTCTPTGLRSAITTANTACVTLAGTGAAASPLSATPVIDPVATNTLTCGPAGLLVTPTAVVSGPCGISGTGTVGSPLVAKVGTWPFPCAQDTFADNVYCSPTTGQLQTRPCGNPGFVQATNTTAYPNVAVPAASTVVQINALNVPNPSTCVSAFVLTESEVDADMDFGPVTGRGALGFVGDEMWAMQNYTASTFQDFHVQSTKAMQNVANIAPGGIAALNQDVVMGQGVNSTYDRIQTVYRALTLPRCT